MYKNIGRKIKGLSKIISLLGISASLIIGILTLVLGIANREFVMYAIGLGIAIVGSLVSWISAFMTYGFGELVDNSQIIREYIEREEK